MNQNKKFISVYKNIYHDKYTTKLNSYIYYKKIIKNNFRESGIKTKEINKLNTFNCGTGLETIVMQSMGTENNIFCDISQYPIDGLNNFIKKKNIKNIATYKQDLCSKKFRIKEKVNFIYLNGVLHHLYNDKIAFKNLDNLIKENGKIFFRNYKSGNLRNFVCEIISKIINFKDSKNFKKNFVRYFGKTELNKNLRFTNFRPGFYESAYDMFFAPIIKYYNVKQFINFFKHYNYNLINKPNVQEYNHSDFRNNATAINIVMQKRKEKKINTSKVTLKPVNQLNIKYKESIIKKNVLAVKSIDFKKVARMNSKTKLYYCFKLFYIAEAYRMSKTLKNVPNFENIKVTHINNMIKIHQNIYKTIQELKNEY